MRIKLFYNFILIACFSLKVDIVNAQNPVHFRLGEDELSGIEIYDIIQDQNNNYFLATDNGIIKYNGYEFKKIYTKNLIGNSVFNFILNKKKQIFCKNLSGQIFQLENDTAHLYYQIPDSLMTIEFNYFFDSKNDLNILSKNLYKIDKEKGTFTNLDSRINQGYYYGYTHFNNSIVFQNSGVKEFYQITDGEITVLKAPFVNLENNSKLFTIGGNLYIWDGYHGFEVRKNNNQLERTKLPPIDLEFGRATRMYNDSNSIWFMLPNGGIHIFDANLILKNKNLIPNTFISTIFKDKEGNYILGTFGAGLIVIPNIDLIEYKLENFRSNISKITSDGIENLYIGTQDGNLFKLSKNSAFEQIKKIGNENISYLKYLENSHSLLVGMTNNPILNLKDKTLKSSLFASLKDIEMIHKNKYIVAMNTGAVYFYPSVNKIEKIKYFDERVNCVNLDTINNTIYAGTAKGLKIGNDDGAKYFLINGKSVICNDIKIIGHKIYISTLDNGLLIFESGKLIKQITTTSDLISNYIKQIKFYKNKLYINSDKGVQILDMAGNVVYTLSSSDGVFAKNILDFELFDNTLWLVQKNGIQPFHTDNLKTINYQPDISFTNIVVNDNDVFTDLDIPSDFNYRTKNFTFVVSSHSLKYRDDIKYQYKLEGFDNQWQTNEYLENKINYNSLPAGNYVFKIKSTYRNNESKTLTYSFSIHKAFWETYWFYGLSLLCISFLIYLFYKSKINKQKREIQVKNELMTLKLKAIKSQMNPHFIFNSLNSIQDLVLQQDANNAYNYIGKFALLVRKILHHSDLDYVDFEEELQIIKLYVELEKLRFKKDFEYSISDPHLSHIEIPPMLIQPFIENAMKHGLLHKKGEKKLQISFKLDSDSIICEIEDNGVGRTQSQHINKRQNKTHDSFTLKSMEQRFNMLQGDFKDKLGFVFKDLTNEDGNCIGTKVTIVIPCKRKF